MSELTIEGVHSQLSTQCFGKTFKLLSSCGSTNDEITLCANQGQPEGLVIAALQQTSGRGRRGRIWYSSDEENLYFSLLLRPNCSPFAAQPMALLAGVSLAKVFFSMGLKPRLKWPNDVLLPTAMGLQKVAGILMELACQGEKIRHLTLGVGINVGGQRFPPELAVKATSLWMCTGQSFLRSNILAGFLNIFEPAYQQFLVEGPDVCLEEYRTFALFGQPCYTEREGIRCEGVAETVDIHGALVLRKPDGSVISIHAGEVHWVNSL